MPIPKRVFQSWRTRDLPQELLLQRNTMIAHNPDYEYFIYTDDEMDTFVYENYDGVIVDCYKKLNIVVAKVDFWRYLVLYKYGGIYLDMDSEIARPLDTLIRSTDSAIISAEGLAEGNPFYFVQWCMMFEAGHPILKNVIDVVVNNIQNNRYPNNVHKMTGPAAYTLGIQYYHAITHNGADLDVTKHNDKLSMNKYNYDETLTTTGVAADKISYRIFGVDYNEYCNFKHSFCEYLRGGDWRQQQLTRPVLSGGGAGAAPPAAAAASGVRFFV
jgi:mannosyltransferase OCH1-like enzyme